MPSEIVRIVVLLQSNQKDKGRYPLSIEIVQKKKTDSLLKKRQKEEKYTHDDPCMLQAISTEVELPLKDNKCTVVFEVTGALKPDHVFAHGENELIFDPKGKTETRRLLVTVPTYDEASDGTAHIEFTANKKYLHRVNINDVPIEPPPSRLSSSASIEGLTQQSSLSSSQSSSSSQIASGSSTGPMSGLGTTAGDQTSVKSSTGSMSKLPSSSGSISDASMNSSSPSVPIAQLKKISIGCSETVQETTSTYVGGASGSTKGLMAIPVQPTPPVTFYGGDGGPDPFGSSDSYDDGDDPSEQGYKSLLSDESLKVIVLHLGPINFSYVITMLGVPEEVVTTNKTNNPGDISQANFLSLKSWRLKARGKGGDIGKVYRNLFEELMSALGTAGRNDMKFAITKVVNICPRALKELDFD